jgi:Ohr subfamily peroxiredoxin
MAVLYTASVHSIGGREGHLNSADGILDMPTQKPAQMGGTGGGTNPEQLFAAAYGACYGGALTFVADKQGIEVPEGFAVDAEVSFNVEGANLFLSATLNVSLPGMDADKAQKLAETAHIVCPYSKAVKGNIEVALNVSV